MPTQVSKGRKIPRLDIATTQEEADLIITQQAIHLAKEDGEVWAAVFTFNPYLLISINELLISINTASSTVFIDISNSFIDINKGIIDINNSFIDINKHG